MKTIGIYRGTENDVDFLGTRRVIDALSSEVSVIMHTSLKSGLEAALGARTCARIEFVDDDILFTKPEVMIVLGGDGAILKAARRCAISGMPLLGINLGRIGYMAELELDELHMLRRLESGEYKVERRMMLEADVGGERLFALNEAVVGGSSIFRIVEIELYCDGKPVNCYRADGLIAATPTGSTAYSMSAGGAVIDPRMDAMLITPICSHSLNATPLVFSAQSELVMKNVTLREEMLYINIDGCEMRTLMLGESVAIRRSNETVGFIRLKDGGFYEVLHHKMADRH